MQLYDLHNEILDLILHQKHVYQGLPSSITEIYHNYYRLTKFDVIKFYYKKNLSNDYIANLRMTKLFSFIFYFI